MTIKSFVSILLLMLIANNSSAADLCTVEEPSQTFHLIKTKHTIAYTKPKLCKPLLVNDFNVIKSFQTQEYNLDWSKTDHDLWHVSGYEVKKVGDPNIQSFDASVNFPVVINNSNNGINTLDQFEVRACSSLPSNDPNNPLEVCGDWQSTSTQCETGCTDNSLEVPTLSVPLGNNITGDYQVSWNLVDYTVDRYKLLESTDNGNNWDIVIDDTIHGNHVDFTDKLNNTIYQYKIKACKSGNICSQFSDIKQLKVITQPDAPTINNVNPSEVNNSWSYNVSWNTTETAVTYVLEESEGDSWSVINASNSQSINVSLTGKTPGQSYYYRVKACNTNNVCGEYSAEKEVELANTKPLKMTDVSIFNDPYSNNYRFNWDDTQNIDHYQIVAVMSSNNAAGYETFPPGQLPLRSTTYDVSTELPITVDYTALISNVNIPDDRFVKFIIRACHLPVSPANCGLWSLISPNIAPSRPLYVESIWYDLAPNYNSEDDNQTYLKIEYFEDFIDSHLETGTFNIWKQGDNSLPITIGLSNYDSSYDNSTNNNRVYKTGLLDRNTYDEYDTLMVNTCVVDPVSGEDYCSENVSVQIPKAPLATGSPNQVAHELLPTPTLSLFSCSSSQNTIEFSLSAEDDGDKDSKLVDYFRVNETQPVYEAFKTTSYQKTSTITYYKEVIRNSNSANASFKLNRLSNGHYEMYVSACHKNEGDIDSCSETVRLAQNNTNPGCDINNNLNIANQVGVTNPVWHEHHTDPSKKVIKWNYSGTNKPDYFYLRPNYDVGDDDSLKPNEAGSKDNACIHTRNVANVNGTTDLKTYSKFEISHFYANEENSIPNVTNLIPGDNEYWSTNMICSEGIDTTSSSQWDIFACEDGIGCAEAVTIDLNNTAFKSSQIPTKQARTNVKAKGNKDSDAGVSSKAIGGP